MMSFLFGAIITVFLEHLRIFLIFSSSSVSVSDIEPGSGIFSSLVVKQEGFFFLLKTHQLF